MISPPGRIKESLALSPAVNVSPLVTVKDPSRVPPPGKATVVTPLAVASLFTTAPAGMVNRAPVDPMVVNPVL